MLDPTDLVWAEVHSEEEAIANSDLWERESRRAEVLIAARLVKLDNAIYNEGIIPAPATCCCA
jgi:hypothetical protein